MTSRFFHGPVVFTLGDGSVHSHVAMLQRRADYLSQQIPLHPNPPGVNFRVAERDAILFAIDVIKKSIDSGGAGGKACRRSWVSRILGGR